MIYVNITISSVKQALAYRIEFFTRMAGSLIELLVLWFVWVSVFAASGLDVIGGFNFSTMLTYLAVASMIRPLIGSIMDFSIEEDVRSGRISTILTKPVSYPLYKIFMGFSTFILSLFVNTLPIFLISFFILRISLPVDLLSFSVSVVLGFFVSYLMIFLTGMWAFWSEGNIWGIKLSKDTISDIMSGSIVPLYLFPDWIANIAKMLPFQTIFNIPISIYLGKITGIEIFYSFLQQIFWIAALGSVCYVVWKQAEKKVIAHGG